MIYSEMLKNIDALEIKSWSVEFYDSISNAYLYFGNCVEEFHLHKTFSIFIKLDLIIFVFINTNVISVYLMPIKL